RFEQCRSRFGIGSGGDYSAAICVPILIPAPRPLRQLNPNNLSNANLVFEPGISSLQREWWPGKKSILKHFGNYLPKKRGARWSNCREWEKRLQIASFCLLTKDLTLSQSTFGLREC